MDEFDKIMEEIKEGFDERGAMLINASYGFSKKMHEGQKRMSGDPYILHCVEVARILKSMKMGSVTISAGLLHDIIEDTPTMFEQIKEVAGEDVAFLVEGVSHVTAKVFRTKGQIFSESLRKMFLAMAKDIRVIIIKLADRLHNMRTVSYLPEERQKIIAQETLNVYAPLAHRLGIASIKSELEDISFGILNPKAYREIADKIAQKKAVRQQRIEELKEIIGRELKKEGLTASIKGRPKHFYSIYQKMIRENKAFENIYDLIALRVITESASQCYAILGIIHGVWTPVPGRFKDYIAMPKSNMYRSLHTTILDRGGNPVEIQIRTEEMDIIAEKGIAAHWNYKEDRSYNKDTDSAYKWIRQLLDWNTSSGGSEEFMKELKVDLFDEEVFVFTPKGDVKELIRGSSVLDFAYSIHSDLGDKCIGAKVNGKWVTIKYELKNGDIIEILTGANQHPVIDWLKTAKTTKARNRIRHWLRTKQDTRENIEKGTNLITRALSDFGVALEDVKDEHWKQAVEYQNLKNKEDLISGVGYGEFSEIRIANFLKKVITERKKVIKEVKVDKKHSKGGIVVDGEYSDITYKFARCCNPVPGDDITGIFTRKGISIHRKNCENLNENKISAPIVKVDWNTDIADYYLSKIWINAKNRDGLINDVLNTITQNQAFISSVDTHIIGGNRVESYISLKVKSSKHMADIISSLKDVKSVTEVKRMD